ncbi:MAG: hypothetical protein ACOYOB_19590 [Myxococcota bacterium]
MQINIEQTQGTFVEQWIRAIIQAHRSEAATLLGEYPNVNVKVTINEFEVDVLEAASILEGRLLTALSAKQALVDEANGTLQTLRSDIERLTNPPAMHAGSDKVSIYKRDLIRTVRLLRQVADECVSDVQVRVSQNSQLISHLIKQSDELIVWASRLSPPAPTAITFINAECALFTRLAEALEAPAVTESEAP